MVVINKDGVVYMAESSYYMPTFTTEKDFLNYPENLHIWHPDEETNKLIMVSGGRRECDVLRYNISFPKPFTIKNIVDNVYYEVAALLNEAGIGEENGESRSNIIFAQKDKAYIMVPNTATERIEEIYADTMDNDVAIGEYFLKKDKPIKEILRGMYKSVEEATMKKQFPIAVLNTKTSEIEYIYGEENV